MPGADAGGKWSRVLSMCCSGRDCRKAGINGQRFGEKGSRSGMGWKLRVSGYGKIESAEIEMAPLTLFVGDNNSGKSYLMSLLWGIRNLGAELLYGERSDPPTEAEDRLLCWVKEQVEAARELGEHTVRVNEIREELQIVLQERINRNKDKFVKAIFNSSDVRIEKL